MRWRVIDDLQQASDLAGAAVAAGGVGLLAGQLDARAGEQRRSQIEEFDSSVTKPAIRPAKSPSGIAQYRSPGAQKVKVRAVIQPNPQPTDVAHTVDS